MHLAIGLYRILRYCEVLFSYVRCGRFGEFRTTVEVASSRFRAQTRGCRPILLTVPYLHLRAIADVKSEYNKE